MEKYSEILVLLKAHFLPTASLVIGHRFQFTKQNQQVNEAVVTCVAYQTASYIWTIKLQQLVEKLPPLEMPRWEGDEGRFFYVFPWCNLLRSHPGKGLLHWMNANMYKGNSYFGNAYKHILSSQLSLRNSLELWELSHISTISQDQSPKSLLRLGRTSVIVFI